MLDAGRKLKSEGLPPIGFPVSHAVGDGNDFCYSILWSFGGKEVEEDGKTVAIESEETRAALEFVKTLFTEAMPEDVLSWDDASNNRAFLAGEISATNNAASIWVVAKNAAPDMYPLIDHAQYPAGPAGRVTYGEMMSQGIFSYSKNIDAAKALIKYLNEKDQLAPWAQAGYSFNYPLLKMYEDLVIMPWNTQPKLSAFKGIAGTSHLPGYPSSNGRAAAEAYAKWIIVDMFAKVCTGTSVDEAMAWAADQLRQIYA
ncbi:MAG: hypothetical protein Kow0047_00480 [Anaerolineae bacterium]